MRHRVVVVRDVRSVVGGGGGCCSGDVRPFDDGGTLPRARECADHHDDVGGDGAVYRALRQHLPVDVDVELVSPSNWLWLLPTLIADGRRRGLQGRELRRSVRAGMAVSSLVVDGAVLSSGTLPSPAAAVAAVQGELALR